MSWSRGTVGSYDLFAGRVRTSPSFGADSGWPSGGTALSLAAGDQSFGTIAADGAGGAIAAWADERNQTTSHTDLYAQRVRANGALPMDPVATITGPPSGSVYAVDTPVSFTGTFTDDGGMHSATWTIDGMSSIAGAVNEASQTVSATHAFTEAAIALVSARACTTCG